MKNAEVLLDDNSRFPIRVMSSKSRSVDRLHMHGFIQIFCVKSGSCIHDLDGDSQKLIPGEVSIAPPMNPHRIDGRNAEYEMFGMDAHCDFFKFSPEFNSWNFFDSCISPLCETVLKKGHVFKPSQNINTEIFKLYNDMKKLSTDITAEKHLLLRGKAIELLSLIATEYSTRENELIGNRASGNCAPMHETFSYIHKNFNNDISLEKISKAAMISERTLYRLFEESMSTSVHQYICQLRLNHAKDLLTETDRTIRDVANDSGFVYLSNFHRFFRSQVGMSPCEYRDTFRR